MSMRIAVVLGVLVALVGAPPSGAAPICSDQLVGVNERCPQWSAAYNHPGGRGGDGEDIGRAVAVSPDGNKVFVTGQSRDDNTLQDQATIAYDAVTGAQLWAARQDHGGGFDTGSAITATNDTVFVTGRSTGQALDWLTTAYDAATGELRWAKRLAGPKRLDDTPWSVVASTDGSTVYVAGGVDDGASVAGDALTVAYDARSGAVLWESRYNGGGYDGGHRLALAPDGSRLYLLGTTRRSGTSNDLLVVAYQTGVAGTAGETVWSSAIDGMNGADNPAAIAVAPDGRSIVVAGTSAGTTTGTDVLTVALDAATGATSWTSRYNGTRNANDTAAGVVIVGNRVVTAAAGGEGVAGFDAVLRAHDLASGSVAWTQIHNTVAYFVDTPLALTSWGDSVYMTGYFVVPRAEIQPIYNIEPGTMTTAAYNVTSGARSWVANHNQSGIGADVGVAIAAGPRGVYPAGTFVFSGVFVYPVTAAKPYAYDIGVVAYRH